MKSLRVSFVLAGLLLILGPTVVAPSSEERSISLTAKKFEWVPSRIEVGIGETVVLMLTSEDAKHGFVSKALGIERVKFSRGETITVRFTPKQAGSYEFKCANFCGLGHRRMKGEIVVLPFE